MSPNQVLEAVRGGLSIVCATCHRYWEAQDLKKTACEQTDCAGPIAGMDFPKYKGELPDLQRWCFACGRDSDFSIKVPDGKRGVGVCKEHVRLLQDLVPAKPVNGVLLLQVGGKFLSLEKVREPTKPTLMQQVILDEIEDAKKCSS